MGQGCKVTTHFVINKVQEHVQEQYLGRLDFLLSLSVLERSKNMTPLHYSTLFSLLSSVLSLRYNSISRDDSLPPFAAKLCAIQNSFQPGFVAKGDFVIGGIFPLHYNQEMPDINSTYRPPPVKCNG